jgi:hypothetical protein
VFGQARTKNSVIMVVFVPIVLGVPAVSIFVPPPLIVIPAKGSRLNEFVAPFRGFRAVRAVLLDRFVKIVIGFAGVFLSSPARTTDVVANNIAPTHTTGANTKRAFRIPLSCGLLLLSF